MSTVVELKELEKVLKKNPVISTYSSDKLISSPESVERSYLKHAMTHMSLGDTKDYENRLFRYLLTNKRAFSGLVTGDFGLGKTSFLVYLWMKCTEKDVMAVPPFSWRTLDDLFQGITSWINYKLERKNNDALAEFQDIADHYNQRSMKKEIDLLVRAGMDKQSAKEHMENKVREGTFRLDRTIDELLQFLELVTNFLVRTGYEGLMVFTDELQITLSELAPEKVFQYMFEIANNTLQREGKYGIMIGLPLNSFVQMQQVKSDALDRFAQQKMLVDLSKLYTADFAVDLWHKYTEYFKFELFAPKIIDEYALKSLGQLTDSTRKDIGNGPRSVISAFNTIINRYENTGEQYTVLDLVDDIMTEEILLGERSKFISKIKGLLQQVDNDPNYTKFIYVLAGFPQGCKQEVILHYGVLNKLTEQLLVDWLGNEIRQSRIEGYRLTVLDEVLSTQEGFFEQSIRNFYRYYQASDREYQDQALLSFNSVIIPELLTEKGQLSWNCLFEQETDEQIEFQKLQGNIYSTEIGGTYNKVKNRYPNRHLQIVTQTSNSEMRVFKKHVTDNNFAYVGQWIFYLDLTERKQNAVEKHDVADISYTFTFNLKEKIEDNLPILADIVPMEAIDIQLALNLIYYLTKTTDIPPSEQQELEYNLREIIDATITTLFNKNMKKIYNSDFEMRNHGKSILIELFERMCEERYPYYRTLMIGRLKQKMNYFKVFLENEHTPLSVKRGTKPIVENYKRLSATDKREVTSKFTLSSVAPFETLLEDYPELIEVKNDGHLYANIHPAEQFCLEVIQESDETINDNNKPCSAVSIYNINDQLRSMGYVSDEIENIYALGALRKLFQYEQKRRMLYIKPLTIEEWKVALQQKLNYIAQLKDELALVNEHFNVNVEKLEQDIENLNDENMYEDLTKEVSEAEIFLQQKMSLYVNKQIDILEEMLNKSSRVLSEVVKKLEEVEVSDYPEKQNWYKAQEKLKDQVIKLQTQYTEIFNGKTALSKTKIKNFSIGNDGIGFFVEVSSTLEGLHKKWNNLKPDRKKFEKDVKSWRGWENYFDTRVELRQLIERLEALGLSHLKEEIDKIDQEMENVWTTDYIPSHTKWIEKLNQVRSIIQTEIKKSRDLFEKEKQGYQKFMQESHITYKLRTQFNEANQSKSYEQLREEFKEAIENQIENWLKQTDQLEQRLAYLTNILEVDVTAVNDEVFTVSSILFRMQTDLKKDLNVEILAPLKTIQLEINTAKEKVENAVKKGDLDKKEEKLLIAMNSSSLSLEELILNYSEETDSLNLEEVLELITNLFKKNHINIRIEKGGK
ncbi:MULTISPECIES: hypothetical protein [Bacillus]|uniref:hypothetical protein n=1 Tax=Bacillus TaxID=1386 RepID=UPI000E2E77B4|nr:hypothetical protein [Bacillus cereus]RFB22480.1 hypothetical protein DZB85_19265 [Bacillus sp. LB(2018)]